jgi:hypothetical protein
VAENNQQDFPEKKKLLKINETLKDFAILLFGLLGSSIFDSLTNNAFKTETKIIVLISAFGLAITILIAFQVRRQVEYIKETVKEEVKDVHQINKQTADSMTLIANRIGATIQINKFGEEVTSTAFNEYIALIDQAESVFVLDAYPWSGQISAEQGGELARWYDALNKFIDKGKPYTRILQNNRHGRTDTLFVEDIKNPIIENHFVKIIEASKVNNPKSFLRCSEIMLPNVAFTLIDKKYLIWEVPMMDPKLPGGKKAFHLSMDLFIEDTSQKVPQEIYNVWNVVREFSVVVKEIKAREKTAQTVKKVHEDE